MNKKFTSLFALIISTFSVVFTNAAPTNLNVEPSYINIKDQKVKRSKYIRLYKIMGKKVM